MGTIAAAPTSRKMSSASSGLAWPHRSLARPARAGAMGMKARSMPGNRAPISRKMRGS